MAAINNEPSPASCTAVPTRRPVFNYYVADTKASLPKLTCAICLEPFYKPRKTPCRHTFCEDCIQRCLASAATCPTCRAPVVEAQLAPGDDTLQELLDDLEVYCANRQHGCKWKGPRSSLQEHVDRTCEHIEKERQKREVEKLCHALNPRASDVVKLLVGGRRFETTLATLCSREPNSVLALMFSNPNKLERNEQGEVLLDLDPEAFEMLLAYLRLGVIPRELSVERADRFAAQARALRLDSLTTTVLGNLPQQSQRDARRDVVTIVHPFVTNVRDLAEAGLPPVSITPPEVVELLRKGYRIVNVESICNQCVLWGVAYHMVK